jgi:hypothetical protein
MKFNYFIPLLSLFLLFTSCEEDEQAPPLYKHALNFDIDHGVINPQSYIEVADAHSGKKISRADVGTNFGFGYSMSLPDSLTGRTVIIDVDGWVRTGDLSNGCELIVSANSRDSLMLWMGCGAKQLMKAPNEWTNVKHTVILNPNLTSKPDLIISILAHNVDAKSFFDVDDLKITFSEQGSPNN